MPLPWPACALQSARARLAPRCNYLTPMRGCMYCQQGIGTSIQRWHTCSTSSTLAHCGINRWRGHVAPRSLRQVFFNVGWDERELLVLVYPAKCKPSPPLQQLLAGKHSHALSTPEIADAVLSIDHNGMQCAVACLRPPHCHMMCESLDEGIRTQSQFSCSTSWQL